MSCFWPIIDGTTIRRQRLIDYTCPHWHIIHDKLERYHTYGVLHKYTDYTCPYWHTHHTHDKMESHPSYTMQSEENFLALKKMGPVYGPPNSNQLGVFHPPKKILRAGNE